MSECCLALQEQYFSLTMGRGYSYVVKSVFLLLF